MLFSSKANTLLELKMNLKKSIIDDLFVFTVYDYRTRFDDIFTYISGNFQNTIIVRSSSSNEDSLAASCAGHYCSCLNVNPQCKNDLKSAIERVILSYANNDVEQQLFVQEQIPVCTSGVILTYDTSNDAPYTIVNYENKGETSAVTSGMSSKTLYVYRGSEYRLGSNALWNTLEEAVLEIEGYCQNKFLDIEFGISADNSIHIFQVRPLVFNRELKNKEDRSIDSNIACATATFANNRSVLSNMAFWNPAEMIGENPHPLDYSLYSKLITESAWNTGIVPMGYSSIPINLMCKIGNAPYIKVNAALSALIPSDISRDLHAKLVEAYTTIFSEDKTKHDKIEFEIVLSNYTFDIDQKQQTLYEIGLTPNEFEDLKESLLWLTKRVISKFPDVSWKDKCSLAVLIKETEELSCRYHGLSCRELHDAIKHFTEAIITHGAVTFARQARCDFIAKSLLYSLVSIGIYLKAEVDEYLATIQTITTERHIDTIRYRKGELTEYYFKQKYCHFRAASYDITSVNYEPLAFSNILDTGPSVVYLNDSVKRPNKKLLADLLEKDNWGITTDQVFEFIEGSRKNREYFKFIYSRALDLLLKLLSRLGEHLGFSDQMMSFLEIGDILSMPDFSKQTVDRLKQLINNHKCFYSENSRLILPEVILDEQDIYVVEYSEHRPNFITNGIIEAGILVLDDISDLERWKEKLYSKIILMERAEPGNDWIFECGIVGLITMYGGAASHMSIRCAENNIPAAIGCGKNLYSRLKQEKRLLIDCQENRIKGVGI